MAIQIPHYQLTSPRLHFDEDGDKCTGNFIFPNNRSLDGLSIRRCDRCQRLETFEKNHIIVMPKSEVTLSEFTEWCAALIKKVQEGIQKTDPHKSFRILPDRSNPERFAAKLFILDFGDMADVRKAVSDLAVRAGKDPEVIREAWRNPLAVRFEKTISYAEKSK